jgi:hypothetical protein
MKEEDDIAGITELGKEEQRGLFVGLNRSVEVI